MYKIKQKPEDFCVKEISTAKIEDGPYLYFMARKKLRNTHDVIKELSKQLRIKEKEIGYAGMKDKYGVTEQLISVYGSSKAKVLSCNIDNVDFEFCGTGSIPISLGDLKGNSFEIVIRDVTKVEKVDFVANYYDEQRFGGKNEKIGKALVLKKFKDVCDMLELNVSRNDYIGAIREISIRMLRFYVNAYQSYLWNECVSWYLSNFDVVKKVNYKLGEFVFVKDKQDILMPLIGFSKFDVPDTLKMIINEIMHTEKIKHKDFIIKQIPEISVEGELRNVFVDVEECKVSKIKSGVAKISFSLPKGSYATMCVRKMAW